MGQIDYTEGRLYLENEHWLLDAEPHVLVLFERLFPASFTRTFYAGMEPSKGLKYTHRPRLLKDTIGARKDINWFIERFNLYVDGEQRSILKGGAERYDAIQREAKEVFLNSEPLDLPLALPLRDYQEQAVALALHRKSLLVADQVGLGKTPIGIGVATKHLPALVTVPNHLVTQWEREIKKFLPQASVYRITKGKLQEIPRRDFIIISHNLLYKYTEELCTRLRPTTLVIDEVHSFRSEFTEKYKSLRAIAEKTEYRVGLSATPIMNYGQELYNIFEILDPGCLGSREGFSREWCNWKKIQDPILLGNYLRKNMMMVRRTRNDVGRNLSEVERVVYTVDADLHALEQMEKEAKVLALKVITGGFHEAGEAARELDVMLRKQTGVAKARSVAEIVKVIVESGEKVVLFGWHRDVYDIWLHELAYYRPVMYTGTESQTQKEDALQKFIDGDSSIFIMSLRSGAGINGLQNVSSYAVFGELDWSPGIIDQCIGRLWREGQENKVTAVFVTIDDGADPIMKKVVGMKATEQQQIINPEADVIASTGDADKILHLAKDYLERLGIDAQGIIDKKEQEQRGELFIPPPMPDHPAARVYQALMRTAFSIGHERDLQEDVAKALERASITYEKEVILSPDSRVDFRTGNTLIECKTAGFSKTNMLRQIKRYKRDYPAVNAIVIVTPDKIRHFLLEGTPVYAVNISDNSLLIGGLA